MAEFQLPEGLRMAAYRAARDWATTHFHQQPDDRMVDAGLAALFDDCEVREEWGCRLAVPDGDIPDCWRESREAAEAMVSWHINNRSIATPALIRRLHLTLAAEVAEDER